MVQFFDKKFWYQSMLKSFWKNSFNYDRLIHKLRNRQTLEMSLNLTIAGLGFQSSFNSALTTRFKNNKCQ